MTANPDGRATVLLDHLEKLHTTVRGAERIRKNLFLWDIPDVVEWCRIQIRAGDSQITRKGKNWYILTPNGCRITVNAGSYTVITAHPAE